MRHPIPPAFAIATALAFAGAAHASPTFSLFWTGTTGTGITGGGAIAAQPGDTLTLDVLVDVDGDGIAAWDFALIGSGVTAVSGLECPSGTSSGSSDNYLGDGTCVTSTLELLHPYDVGVLVVGSDILDFAALNINGIAGPLFQPIFAARAVFLANGPGQVDVGGLMQLFDAQYVESTDTATATIVPEPGTLALVGLGTSALALARRRPGRAPRHVAGAPGLSPPAGAPSPRGGCPRRPRSCSSR